MPTTLKLQQITMTLVREFRKNSYGLCMKLRWAFVHNAYKKLAAFPWKSALDMANPILEHDVASWPEPVVAIWYCRQITNGKSLRLPNTEQLCELANILRDLGVRSIVHMGDDVPDFPEQEMAMPPKAFTHVSIRDYQAQNGFKIFFAKDAIGSLISGQILTQLLLSTKIAVNVSATCGGMEHLALIGLPVVMFSTSTPPLHDPMVRLCNECPWWKYVAAEPAVDSEAEKGDDCGTSRLSARGRHALRTAIDDSLKAWTKSDVLTDLRRRAFEDILNIQFKIHTHL